MKYEFLIFKVTIMRTYQSPRKKKKKNDFNIHFILYLTILWKKVRNVR